MTYSVVYFTTKSMAHKREAFKDLTQACLRMARISKRKGFIAGVLLDSNGDVLSAKRCALITQHASITCVGASV
jgi:hypothetical protein